MEQVFGALISKFYDSLRRGIFLEIQFTIAYLHTVCTQEFLDHCMVHKTGTLC